MIIGFVTPDFEAAVHLQVQGPAGSEEIEIAVDTGFNGSLMLPLAMITELGCPEVGSSQTTLADGHRVEMRVFEVTVVWHGEARLVEALGTEGGALVGMSLLQGHKLEIEVTDGGAVTI